MAAIRQSESNPMSAFITYFFRIAIICLGSIKLVECRPGPIFGLEATEISKDGILLSWLPGSREVEEYRLTITSKCTNWMIPECENSARRIRRSMDDEYYNTVEDDEVMKLLEVSNDDTELMGDYQIGDNDMEKDKADTMLPNGHCKVRMVYAQFIVLMKNISGRRKHNRVAPPHLPPDNCSPRPRVLNHNCSKVKQSHIWT